MDPLSDILRLTAASSVVAGGFSADGDWALRFPPPEAIKMFVVTKGTCWLRLGGAQRLDATDVFLVNAKRSFVLASTLEVAPRDARRAWKASDGGFATIGNGTDFSALSGHISLHAASGDLFSDVLPSVVIVRKAASLGWLLEQLVAEHHSTAPGASTVSGQLGQLLFVQILRAHLASGDALPAGWLRVMRDERLLPALRAMHAEPARGWTAHELARAAGMSRSTFAERFTTVAGVAPLAYLTNWRMRLAQKRLREGDAGVAEIASSLGYASESAFSTAFKRVTGASPRAYRGVSRKSSGVSRIR